MKEKDLIKLIVNSVKKVVGKKTSSLHEPIFYGNEKKYVIIQNQSMQLH